ncbi:MAG: AMP-binding protein, partial [Nocardioidaceae bacterium]
MDRGPVSETVPDTIPGLLVTAADRDPAGVWLRSDDGALTFAGAAGRVRLRAGRLRAEGVRRGDLVVVVARTTPSYVLCWLALATLGAVTVPTGIGAGRFVAPVREQDVEVEQRRPGRHQPGGAGVGDHRPRPDLADQ